MKDISLAFLLKIFGVTQCRGIMWNLRLAFDFAFNLESSLSAFQQAKTRWKGSKTYSFFLAAKKWEFLALFGDSS